MRFPEKLWMLVNECTTGAICWGTDGKTIFVDSIKFENEILDGNFRIFKTRNIISFIRQMNLYGFRKCSRYDDIHEFKHKYFIRGRRDLLKLMKRKPGHSQVFPSNNANDTESSEVTDAKKKHVSGSCKTTFKNVSSTESLNETSCSFSSTVQKSFPYGWWRDPYFSMNSILSMENNPEKNCVEMANNEGTHESICQKIDDKNPARMCNNPDMCKNIVFVPVPAYPFDMYPGFYNDRMPFMFPVVGQEENKVVTDLHK